jgi:hypothetical protein
MNCRMNFYDLMLGYSSAYNFQFISRMPSTDEIEHNLQRFPMRARTKEEHEKQIDQIKEIMRPEQRRYLTVLSPSDELNMKQTIFHAIFKGK